MNTNDIDNLSAWLDGELDEEQSNDVRKMLFNDAQAAMACADFRKLDKLMQKHQAPEPPVLLEEVICISAKHDPLKSPFFRMIRVAIPVAAAAIVVLVIMMWVNGPLHNTSKARLDWSSLTPQQQSQAAQSAKAFLSLSTQKQDKILADFQKQFNISPTQNSWVGPVLSSFTPQQQDELKKLSPAERLEVLRKRQFEMMSGGIISQDPIPN